MSGTKTFAKLFAAVAAALVLCSHTCCAQAEPPRDISSAPCARAPRVDGRFERGSPRSDGEWDGAARYPFTMHMAKLGGTAQPRQAELFVMNSSENLYLALRVPDPERQASLNPLKTDLALLAFARGAALAPGDDRKIVFPGGYADKHVVTPAAPPAPAKDADDAKRHGQGAMAYGAGQ